MNKGMATVVGQWPDPKIFAMSLEKITEVNDFYQSSSCLIYPLGFFIEVACMSVLGACLRTSEPGGSRFETTSRGC